MNLTSEIKIKDIIEFENILMFSKKLVNCQYPK